MTPPPNIVALIPARSGSERLPDKNIKHLAGHSLIAYTIGAALESGIFEEVIVSTDSRQYAEIATAYGATVPFLRPPEFSGSLSPDIEWVKYTLDHLRKAGKTYDCFSILRPTSPFRQPATIQRAWKQFRAESGVDSLRAVEKCKQHPGKMWVVRGNRMLPLLPLSPVDRPWHSCQYPSLPEVFVQNASLEIAWTRIVFEHDAIAGNTVVPFYTKGYEGFDINTPFDWHMAEYYLENNLVQLPDVNRQPS